MLLFDARTVHVHRFVQSSPGPFVVVVVVAMVAHVQQFQ